MGNHNNYKGKDYELHILKYIHHVLVTVIGQKYENIELEYNVRIDGKIIKQYQIDIFGHLSKEWFLIECKNYTEPISYDIIASQILKATDIHNNFPDYTIFLIFVTSSSYNANVLKLHTKIDDISKYSLINRFKILRISSSTIFDNIIVYDCTEESIQDYPIIINNALHIGDVDEHIEIIKHNTAFAKRIDSAIKLLDLFSTNNKSESLKNCIELLCFENLSNCFMHLHEYYDAEYFATKLKYLRPSTKEVLFEAEILSAISKYNISKLRNTAHPGYNSVLHLNKIMSEMPNDSNQKISTQLFIGKWLAKYSKEPEKGIKYLKNCLSSSVSDKNPYYKFLSYFRLFETTGDKDKAYNYYMDSSKLVNELLPKHKSIAIDLLKFYSTK
ncbi:MAG: hypothetical protein PHN88_00985 [Ignavibacteria bacterium]|nr:hypothetical protein [Ignavibacteria bacterium]